MMYTITSDEYEYGIFTYRSVLGKGFFSDEMGATVHKRGVFMNKKYFSRDTIADNQFVSLYYRLTVFRRVAPAGSPSGPFPDPIIFFFSVHLK